MTIKGSELTAVWPRVTNKDFRRPRGAKRASCCLRILSASLTVLFSVCAWSQTQLADLSGTITDPTGAVVPGVSVTIVGHDTGLKCGALTDTAGEYRFGGLPAGDYSVRVEKTGFQAQSRERVALAPTSGLIVNFSLTLSDRREQVTVNANTSGIDSTTSTVGELVAEQSLSETASQQSGSVQCGSAGAWSRSRSQQCALVAFERKGCASGD